MAEDQKPAAVPARMGILSVDLALPNLTITIPRPVADKLLAYHEADLTAKAGYLALLDASRRGDEKRASEIEAGRDARRAAQDRARVELDEAIRAWGG